MSEATSYGDSLDWTVTRYNTQILTNPPTSDPNTFALLRSDIPSPYNILGYVSKDYEAVQNQKLLDLAQPLIDNGIAYIANQGYLQYGKKVFLQLNLYENFRITDHNHKSFITILNSFNGTSTLGIGTGSIRVICQNTFLAAQQELNTKLAHRLGINDKLDLSVVLQYVNTTNTIYKQNVEILDKIKIPVDKLGKIIRHVFGADVKDKIYNNIVSLYRTGNGNTGSTAYDLFSATTDYVSHYQSKNPISSASNPLIGNGAKKSQKMLETLLALV